MEVLEKLIKEIVLNRDLTSEFKFELKKALNKLTSLPSRGQNIELVGGLAILRSEDNSRERLQLTVFLNEVPETTHYMSGVRYIKFSGAKFTPKIKTNWDISTGGGLPCIKCGRKEANLVGFACDCAGF